MKKVLFINHSNNVFGAETILLSILERCYTKEEREKFVYAAEPKTRHAESAFRKNVESLGVRNIISAPYKNIGGSIIRMLVVLVYNLLAAAKLSWYVKKNGIDIIYSNTSVTCVGVFVALFCNKRHIWHIHETVQKEHGFNDRLIPIYRLLFAYKKNELIFITQAQKDQWENIFDLKRCHLVYNCFYECKTFATEKDNEKTVFGFLGSRSKRKNIISLLNSYKAFKDEAHKTFLYLNKAIGTDNDRIREVIANDDFLSKTTKEIEFYERDSFYEKIDVLVLPSWAEAWGLVVLEAMSAGVATIVTNKAGIIEILEDGKDTLIIDPSSEESITNAMMKMTDTEYRKKIIENATNKLKAIDLNNKFKARIRKILM